ncbi:GPR1/FUN34/YaaH family transporter [Haloactinomyces albus]|uniref:Succinate-acetate transporter protein n=1 Tax=Haloactinomyces albus TaxID=1352928 RepID=A0AAE3ZIB8_9ACTN|nr:GPR1/FUN34/YaaH family transporter [Haloactinomyces albus]MDR7304118.1 succinate-acetate transporter protein [Haloactinomyces albus]
MGALVRFDGHEDGYAQRMASTPPQQSFSHISLRPYGNPLPLGLFSFGIGMVLLAGIAFQWMHGMEVRAAGILMAAFVFPLELLAAVLAFLARDTGAASALGLFATSWLALGLLHVVFPTMRTSFAAGLFLAAFAVMLIPLAVAASLGKRLLALVLSVSTIRAGLAAAYQLGAPHAVALADGAAALALSVLSLYGGTAFLLEDIRQRTLLPVLRSGSGLRAINAELGDQFRRLPQEPGIRQQL